MIVDSSLILEMMWDQSTAFYRMKIDEALQKKQTHTIHKNGNKLD